MAPHRRACHEYPFKSAHHQHHHCYILGVRFPYFGADFFGKSSKALGWAIVASGRIRQGVMASTVSNCLAGGVLLFSISVNSHQLNFGTIICFYFWFSRWKIRLCWQFWEQKPSTSAFLCWTEKSRIVLYQAVAHPELLQRGSDGNCGILLIVAINLPPPSWPSPSSSSPSWRW